MPRQIKNPKPQTLVKHLMKDIWVVSFYKVSDNSLRHMVCTLLKDFVGAYDQKAAIELGMERGALPVYDIENEGWRSFRFESVVSMIKYEPQKTTKKKTKKKTRKKP